MIADAGIGSESLKEVFGRFLSVPAFQREYAWEQENVRALLDDLRTAFKREADQYFMGALVFSKESNGNYAIIDGQQRLTTLYILMCAVLSKANQLEATALRSVITELISSQRYEPHLKKYVPAYKLAPAYEDAQVFITMVSKGPKQAGEYESSPVDLMADAFDECRSWLDEYFQSEESLNEFFNFVSERTAFLLHVTKTVEEGLVVFEILNTRGVKLSYLDLVKALMFSKSPSHWDLVKERWKEFETIYEDLQEKSGRFLRYFIIVECGCSDDVPEDKAYSWIKDRVDTLVKKGGSTEFIAKLRRFTERWRNLAEGRLPDGKESTVFKNLKSLTRSSRQHLPVLLSAHQLPVADQEKLARGIEMYQLSLSLLREFTGSVEAQYLDWSRDLVAMGQSLDPDWFTNDFAGVCEREINRAIDVVAVTERSHFNKAKYAYLLKKLEFDAQSQAGYQDASIAALHRGIELEHIWPWAREGEVDSAGCVVGRAEIDSLGNICLLERPLNAKIKDREFDFKCKEGYAKSRLISTRAITMAASGGSAFDIALRKFRTYDSWGVEEIRSRGAEISNLLREAFRLG